MHSLYFTCPNYYSQHLGQKTFATDQSSKEFNDNVEWEPLQKKLLVIVPKKHLLSSRRNYQIIAYFCMSHTM